MNSGAREGEREVVAAYATHAEADDALRLLAERKVDAECVIVSRDALSMAGMTPRRPSRRYGMWIGAVLGGAIGAIFGMTLGLAWLTLPGLVLGALIGAGLAPSKVANATPSPIRTERHDVVVHRDHAADARRVLGESGLRVK